jgi:hypothetical protein
MRFARWDKLTKISQWGASPQSETAISTPTTQPDLLRFYLRRALDGRSFNTHLLLVLIDQAEEQGLIKTLLDEALAELQVQAQDIAALAAQVELVLPSQRGPIRITTRHRRS